MPEFHIEITIAAPIDDVWHALREPATIRHWHGWEFEENGGLDAEIEQIFAVGVVESPEDHTLTLQGGDTFTLHSLDDGRTLVKLVRPPLGENPEWDAFYDDISQGWVTFLHQLRFALERHPGVARRTVFLDGVGGLEVLGLPEGEPGSRYSASVAGETMVGEVWFRSELQAGYTVDGWGDGLLIVGAAPQGGAMAVLTTYGHNDEEYQAFRNRWTTWWREHFAERAKISDSD